MPKRPNILLITTDTRRWDTLRCMPGAPAFVRSPNPDALAAEGVLFQNARTSFPVCMPARFSRGEPSPRQYAVATLLTSTALATRRWKLAYCFEDGRGPLFDRTNDPGEQRDLWDDPAHRAIRDRLLFGLLSWQGDAMDLHGLVARSHRGGLIAGRAVRHIKQVTGLDAEERLDRICQEVDPSSDGTRNTHQATRS